ncbi:hypothetical protein PSH81_20965 [Pseudomonas sp. FP2335]|jgi:hypothetical protein|uniref:hypothetical protein n=1 Tax=Pseudomonas sp. FP2335 TaxID=2954092 RepID=UPI002735777B|nr:hypothetical protein [Pseudomonas sp. FP2335]WLH78180.1 hypothetical protein PSH81_20965 [Pseudomonas sp. FP2335]
MNTTPNKNPKFRGYFNVTKSPFGSFSATEYYFMASGVMIVTGSTTLPSGDKILIELNVVLAHGTSKGDFQVTDGDGRPWAFGIRIDSNGGGVFYNADSGSYEMIYIEKASHLTGKLNFISNSAGTDNEFEAEYNITPT